MRAARKGDVEVQELPLPADQHAEEAYAEFIKDWEARVAASKNDNKPPSLMKVRARLPCGSGRCTVRHRVVGSRDDFTILFLREKRELTHPSPLLNSRW